jgi:zinc protease
VEVTRDELSLGRDSLVLSLPGRFETTGQAAGSFATLFVYDLGLDYYSRYMEKVLGIDAATAHTAAQKHLMPERMLVVAVGDRKKIEADMAKLNLGTIEYRDADGNVITASGSGGPSR